MCYDYIARFTSHSIRMNYAAGIAIACVALAGCSTQLYGNQSVTGGMSTTATSSATLWSASTTNSQVSFSSGAAVPPSAPGGQVSLGRGGSGALILGIVLVDALQNFAGWLSAPKQPASMLPASIADTCSCYGYKPVIRDQ